MTDELDPTFFAVRIGATLFFVLANGFFVAAEFALVKVRLNEFDTLANAGDSRARLAQSIRRHLDLYLSACQLGVTLSSLILGWLAEPAVAQLLIAGARVVDLAVSERVLHVVALGIALTIVTVLHMTIGEQAPKIWAIHRARATALRVARPLGLFARLFRPFIWIVNEISNGMLRMAGLSAEEVGEGAHNVDELKGLLAASAQQGHISVRQREIAENVFGLIALEVRHIMVPRVDAVFLTLQNEPEENVRIIGESGHSRFPLCRVGLDTVIGIVHAKDVMKVVLEGETPDLQKLAREALFVSDTQPLSRLILRMQRTRTHCAVVLDEHGSAVGLTFLEDALEEIVGPLGDEFDQEGPSVQRRTNGTIEVVGDLALPEAAQELGLADLDDESDTIGGYVIARLGRLPRRGDVVAIGPYQVSVTEVRRNRVVSLLFRAPTGDRRRDVPADRSGDAS